MNGRHDDPIRGTPHGAHHADAVDPVSAVLRDAPDLAPALEALPATLEPVALPDGAWERLASALAGPASVARERSEPQRVAIASRPAASSVGWRFGSTHPLSWLAAAVIVGAVVGLGTWGTLQSAGRARVIDEQRVLAYWMANPDLRMVALRQAGPTTSADVADGRLGVVCVLPDGRALLLQPAPAGRGTRYVVVSRGEEGDTELARGTGNVIRFDIADAQRVVVMHEGRDGVRVPVAWADVN